jgi:xanthosine utilization system XapX-like protein
MTFHLQLEYLLALIAGIAILVSPRLLNFIVAIYLIVTGLIGILGIRVN